MEYSKLILAKPSGEEIGELPENVEVDLDIISTFDFQMRIPYSEWSADRYGYGCKFFMPGKEYGGIIDDIHSVTSSREVEVSGLTWRGMLQKKIVEPPTGQSHLILSGEMNDVIMELIGDRFEGFIVGSEEFTDIHVSNWQVDRYVTVYDAVEKLVKAYGCRMQIVYVQPRDLEYGYVTVGAVPVVDYSDLLEYSQEGKVNVDIRDYRGGINHLICVGEGENQERIVLHLFVGEDGTIGQTQYYFGIEERQALYNYSSADETQLLEDGTKRLQELQNYKSVEMTVEDIDLEIGDIVAGYDDITDTRVVQPVIGKIFKVQGEKTTIEYKMKGDS